MAIKKELIRNTKKSKIKSISLSQTIDYLKGLYPTYTFKIEYWHLALICDLFYKNDIEKFKINYNSWAWDSYFPAKENKDIMDKIDKAMKAHNLKASYKGGYGEGQCRVYRETISYNIPHYIKTEPLNDSVKKYILEAFDKSIKSHPHSSHFTVERFTNNLIFTREINRGYKFFIETYPEIFKDYKINGKYVTFTLKYDPEQPQINEKIFNMIEENAEFALISFMQFIDKQNERKNQKHEKEV
jgi:hypothetical protein